MSTNNAFSPTELELLIEAVNESVEKYICSIELRKIQSNQDVDSAKENWRAIYKYQENIERLSLIKYKLERLELKL